jgi:hypothetical protein
MGKYDLFFHWRHGHGTMGWSKSRVENSLVKSVQKMPRSVGALTNVGA